MKTIIIPLLLLMTSCSAIAPDLFKAVDDIETDTAIKIEIDKEAIKKETDIKISVDVLNKDIKQP